MAMDRNTRAEFAIKFFVSESSFKDECEIYRTDATARNRMLVQFLPRVRPLAVLLNTVNLRTAMYMFLSLEPYK